MEAQRKNPESEAIEEEEQLARDIVSWSWDLKAVNTVAIDLRGRVSYTDFLVVCTGNSERHVQSIAKHVEVMVKQNAGKAAYGREGVDYGKWALVDFGDVIFHVFNGNLREEYDLERMWTEAPRLEFEDAPTDLYGHFEMDAFED